MLEFVSANGQEYFKADTLSDLKLQIRQHLPCTTQLKAIPYFDTVLNETAHNVISLSPYSIGPNFYGRIYGVN